MAYHYMRAAIPFFGLAVNVLSQIVSFRIIPKRGLLNSVFLGFCVGFIVLFVFEFYIFLQQSALKRESAAIIIVHLLTYTSLGYCYFHFVNLGETARRIRILRELLDAPGGLSLKDILKHYNAKEIVERRLERLLKKGQITVKNDKYYIARRQVLWISRLILTLKLILLGKRDEYSRLYYYSGS